MKHYVQEADRAKASTQRASEKAMKNYIANFLLMEEYQCFEAYWKRFTYIELVDMVWELFLKLDAVKLRIEFLEEVHQNPC